MPGQLSKKSLLIAPRRSTYQVKKFEGEFFSPSAEIKLSKKSLMLNRVVNTDGWFGCGYWMVKAEPPKRLLFKSSTPTKPSVNFFSDMERKANLKIARPIKLSKAFEKEGVHYVNIIENGLANKEFTINASFAQAIMQLSKKKGDFFLLEDAVLYKNKKELIGMIGLTRIGR